MRLSGHFCRAEFRTRDHRSSRSLHTGSRGTGLLGAHRVPRGSAQGQRERRRRAGNKGWHGHKRGYSCHFSPSFSLHLGRFETKNGTKVCAKAKEPWVEKTVERLQKRNRLPAP